MLHWDKEDRDYGFIDRYLNGGGDDSDDFEDYDISHFIDMVDDPEMRKKMKRLNDPFYETSEDEEYGDEEKESDEYREEEEDPDEHSNE